MARILPETPPQSGSRDVLRAFRALKKLPDTFLIWHHLAPWVPKAPDFLLIDKVGRALLVKISSTPASQAIPAAQLLLIADERLPLGAAESAILTAFLEEVNISTHESLNTLVVFAAISHRNVLNSRQGRAPGEPFWVGKELLQEDNELEWQSYFPEQALDSLHLEKIRQRFTPESVIAAEETVRQPVRRRLEAGLTGFLLDYDQEMAVKVDLDLDLEDELLTRNFRLNIINGVAGSGKTLILLYRLRLLYNLYPHKQYLVLTHNRPLNNDLQSRFMRLSGKLPENIEFRTFQGWCFQHWPQDLVWIDPLSEPQRKQFARQAWKKHLVKTNVTEGMLLSEINWMQDQPSLTKETYLQADRGGRGFALSAAQRELLFAASEAYQEILRVNAARDWNEAPRCIWHALQEKPEDFPQYDVILIDETQFFAPMWIQIIQRLLRDKNAHLFMVADPTQGFLGRGSSWKSLGLEARGRTHRLQHSYRTTRQIMQLATQFYRMRVEAEPEDDILAPDLLNMPDGTPPQLVCLESAQDEIARVSNEAAELVEKGLPRRHLLLLHANGQGVNALIQSLNRRLGKDAAMNPKDTCPGNYIRVTTLNAGAGLESPIVFLLGLSHLVEQENSLRIAGGERQVLVRDNSRKIYMAATRAGQRLVLTWVGEIPDLFRALPLQITT
jgi:hypothetical protein